MSANGEDVATSAGPLLSLTILAKWTSTKNERLFGHAGEHISKQQDVLVTRTDAYLNGACSSQLSGAEKLSMICIRGSRAPWQGWLEDG